MTAFDVFTLAVIVIGLIATLAGVLLFAYLVALDIIDIHRRFRAQRDTARRGASDERRSRAALHPRTGLVQPSGHPQFFRPRHARNRHGR